MHRGGRRALAITLATLLPVVGLTTLGVQKASAAGTLIFTEGFTNNSVPDSHWVIGGSNFTPCLTVGGNPATGAIHSCPAATDPAGTGALRLTDNGGNESGYVLYNSPLPATAGLDITFDQYQYNGSGADGIAFFLTDGQYQLVAPGTAGGYLGYAGGNQGIGNGNGVAHGLFGVGLDAYGNYTNFENTAAADGGNCPNTYTPAFQPDHVSLRGPGNADKVNYCFLAGAAAPTTLHKDSATDRTDGGLNDVKRTVHITVDPSSNVNPKVAVSINGTVVLQANEPPVSSTVKFGWTASTGGATDIHEIRSLSVSTINPLNPSLSMVASATPAAFDTPGSTQLTETVTNASSANFETQPFTLTVPVPAGLSVTGASSVDPNWNCGATTAAQASCTYTPTGYGFAPSTSSSVLVNVLSASSYSHNNLSVVGSISSPDGGSPTATATFTVRPVVQPSAIVTPANTPATVAQGALGTSPYTWLAGPAGNPALFSSFSVDASGNLTVTPAPNVSGVTTIGLSATDGSGASSTTKSVPVTISPVTAAASGSGTGPAPVYVNIPAPVGTGPFTYTFVSTPNPATVGTVQFVAGVPEQIKFSPVQGFSGPVPSFNYTVTDAAGTPSNASAVSITVNKPAPPTVSPVSGTVDVNNAFSQVVPSPTGASPFGYAITTQPPAFAGSAAITNAGAFTYTPAVNWSGIASMQYAATDQYGQPSAPGTVQVTVRPTAQNASGTTTGPTPLVINPAAPVGTGPFTWNATPTQANGALSMNISTGQVNYTPAQGFTGVFSFPFNVTDGNGVASTGHTVTITVTKPAGPVAAPGAFTTLADTAFTSPMPAPSSGVGPFTYAVNTPPATGSLALTPSGTLSFQPANGTSGVVTFTYRVTDQYGQVSAPATVTITVRPTAPDLSGTTTGPQPKTLTPGPGTIDGTGPFTTQITQPPAAQGSATVSGNSITYTPKVGFTGVASFTYTVTDASSVVSPSANVFVTVTAPAPPVAGNGSGVTDSGSSVSFPVPLTSGVCPCTWTIATNAPGAQGTASIDNAGSATFASTFGYSGTSTFTVKVTDAYNQQSAAATQSVQVRPIAQALNGSSTGPNPVVATPAAPTGVGPFTFALVNASLPPGSKGTTSINGSTGTITFTPVIGFSGAVSFQYTATDTSGLTSLPATVNYTVNKPAGPGVSPTSGTTTVNTPVIVNPPATTGQPPFVYAISTAPNPAKGTATINSSTGAITFTPANNVSGVATLQYTATDPYNQTSAPATVTVTVKPTEANGSAGPVTYPATLFGTVPAAVGSGPFTYGLDSGTSMGSLTLNPNGTFSYTPALGTAGTDGFTFHAVDTNGISSATASETITVTAPAPPTNSNATGTTDAGTPINVDLSAVSSGTGPLTYSLPFGPPGGVGAFSLNGATGLLGYTPAANYSGHVPSFNFDVTDAWGQSSRASVLLTVRPIAANASASTVGPQPVIFTPAAPTGTGPFTYAISTAPNPAQGTASIDPNTGAITFTPVVGWTGVSPFQYTVTDSGGVTSLPANVSVTVTAPPAPVLANSTLNTSADTPVSAVLPLANGVSPYSYTFDANGPNFGSATFTVNDPNQPATINYTPQAGMSGYTWVTYHVTDPYGQSSNEGFIGIAVRPVAPDVAGNTTYPSSAIMQPNPPDGTGPFSYALATQPNPSEGTASIDSGTGVVTFTPALGFWGVSTFTYTATDAASLTSDPATVTVTVSKPAAPNTSPVDLTTDALTPGSADASFATSGVGPLQYSLSGSVPGGAGTASIDPNSGVVSFTPSGTFSGSFTLQYTAMDAWEQSSTSDVNVTVTPVAFDASGSGVGPSAVLVAPPAPAGTGPFTYELLTTPPANQGTASMDPSTGVVTFTPAVGFSGTADNFTYDVLDASSNSSNAANISVTVTLPAPPAANDGTITTIAGVTGTTTPSFTTPACPCTITITVTPPVGEGVPSYDSGTGLISFAPANGFSGVSSLGFTVTDQYGQVSNTGTIAVRVSPIAAPASGTGVGPTPLVINPPAPTGTGPFTYSLVTTPPGGQGTATINGSTGAITFTPALGFSGNATGVTYRVTDASGGPSAPAAVSITITLPAAPTLGGASATTDAGVPVTVGPGAVSATAPLTYAISAAPAPALGTASINPATGVVTFTPTAGHSGLATLTQTVTDQYSRTSAPATDTVTIRPLAGPVTGAATAPAPIVVTPPAPTGTGPFTYALVLGSLPPSADGTVSIAPATGTITFTPAANFTGSVPTFQYTVTDGSGVVSSPANVTLVSTVPNAPSAPASSGITFVGQPITIPLGQPVGNCPCVLTLVTPPSAGTATLDGGHNTLTYTPAPGQSGVVTATYTLTDTYGSVSAPITVTITITPVAQPVSGSGTQGGGPITITPPAPTGVGPFIYTLVPGSLPPASDGTITIDPNTGAITFTPTSSFVGSVRAQYIVTDARGVQSQPVDVVFDVAGAATAAPNTGAHLTSRLPVGAGLILLGMGVLGLSLVPTLRRRLRGAR